MDSSMLEIVEGNDQAVQLIQGPPQIDTRKLQMHFDMFKLAVVKDKCYKLVCVIDSKLGQCGSGGKSFWATNGWHPHITSLLGLNVSFDINEVLRVWSKQGPNSKHCIFFPTYKMAQ